MQSGQRATHIFHQELFHSSLLGEVKFVSGHVADKVKDIFLKQKKKIGSGVAKHRVGHREMEIKHH